MGNVKSSVDGSETSDCQESVDAVGSLMIVVGLLCIVGALLVHGFFAGEVGWALPYVGSVPLEGKLTEVWGLSGLLATVLGVGLLWWGEALSEAEPQRLVGLEEH